jgi:hypothetical protein
MVYRITFVDIRSAQHAWNFVKDFSVPEMHCWKTMLLTNRTRLIEDEYDVVDNKLSVDNPSTSSAFNFAVRYQLMALVLEGTITPLKMTDLIPHVQRIAKQHGAEFTAAAVRRLGQQVPTPAPHTDAKSFNIQTLVDLMHKSIKDSRSRESTSQDLNGRQKKHNHLALTYKATVTPTGTFCSGHTARLH